MSFSFGALEQAAQRFGRATTSRNLFDAKASGQQTAFLSHSSADKLLALGLQVLLRENGWQVYLYWQDAEMPEPPSRTNAENVQAKIKEAQWFLFLATPSSMKSRWCPWEIGYADGVKNYDAIMIVATIDYSGKWYGNEYLQLYRHISPAQGGGLITLKPGNMRGTFLKDLTDPLSFFI